MALLLLCFISLTFHFSSLFSQIEDDGRFHISDPDSLLFLRFFQQSLLRGEDLKFDEYGTYPNFRRLEYPPLHLQLYLNIARFIYALFPETTINPEFMIGWLPPVLGWAVGLIFIVFAWQKTRNRSLTLIVAFACVPGIISQMNSMFLRVDYHFLNCFFIWLWFYFGWRFVESGQKLWGVMGVLATTLFMLSWSGTPLFFAIMTVYAIYLWLADSQMARYFHEYSFVSMFCSSILVFLYLLKNGIWTVEIGFFGWFQPVAIMIGAIFIKGITLIDEKFKPRIWSRLMAIFLPAAIGIAFLYLIFPEQIVGSYTFFMKGDLLMKSISELKPGIKLNNLIKDFGWFKEPLRCLGIFFFLFPLTLTTNPGGIFSGSGKLMRDALILIVLMGLHSVRFYRWLGMGIGFLAGISIYALYWCVKPKFEKEKLVVFKSAVLLLPFMLLNFVFNYSNFHVGFIIKPDEVDAYEWIKKETPVTSGFFDKGRPEYCFYSYWDEGNRIAYYGQRPTLSNNAMWGYGKMAEILTAESEPEAYYACEKYGVRYLYITQRKIPNSIIRFQKAYKLRPDIPQDGYKFFPEFKDHLPEKPDDKFPDEDQTNVAPEETSENPFEKISEKPGDMEKTFHFWLSYCGAIKSNENFSHAASRLRIVYSSKQTHRLVAPRILIYEFVHGARIVGHADPGTEVKLSLECRFDLTQMLYARETITDKDGNYEIVVPYSTGYENGRIKTDPFYKLSCTIGGILQKSTCNVSEDDVLKAEVVSPKPFK